ncbi:hypothetical protein Pmar_PMAR003175 [Perkinsus marinus ATCC 50983]|uniref:Uncharacterized protein n=1 Tax=Perkinsus marinus (strain ATCC 50983 / TXsc) TaxID=423536 RepID=C5L1R0_PERM5|nr:hypothetical protein Pmar_PMAR003175 [Perkinsus marinus ATCC 50983]EER09327.1 hypothetical protein Pmar_PMAR003175 [Perkinsus marinus ATCC 50983]|eukprot:XP_002777511.1 hypothetical protein Pmar_PMAR003175 [Perkinsus marinus ATCC 50983]
MISLLYKNRYSWYGEAIVEGFIPHLNDIVKSQNTSVIRESDDTPPITKRITPKCIRFLLGIIKERLYIIITTFWIYKDTPFWMLDSH